MAIMNRTRILAAVVIALSLVLPQRSCMSGGHVETIYPLSGADSVLVTLLIVGLYCIPLLVLFIPRFRMSGLVLGIAAVSAGLYFFAYGGWLLASSLLVGWYAYTFGAIAYLGASLALLARIVVGWISERKRRHSVSPPP